MKKNSKDYLIKNLLLQLVVCAILFASLFALKSANSSLFKEIEDMFSKKLEENITVSEAEQVVSKINTVFVPETTEPPTLNKKQEETEYIPFEEPSLSAQIIATGGNDEKISSEGDIPKNVSTDDYQLSQPMILPVVGKTTSDFGVRLHPISGDLRYHAGIDIAAKKGTNIYSAFDGEVVLADYDQWNGNFLKIKHTNGIMTVYCHCENLNVKKGDVVRAGEVIATVGSTGSSTGPHLHFELRINDISYNPQIALNEALNAV